MLYSVIIPAYNCEDHIEDCIESVLSQLTEDCELIIVDDGSTDGTRDLLGKYENSNYNVSVLYETHKGASAARNRGIEKAAGDYISFTDADNRLKDGFISCTLDSIDDGTDLRIFGIERKLYDGRIEPATVSDREFTDSSVFADAYIREHKFMIYSCCNKFYRRSHIEDMNIRFNEDVSFGEDRLFNYSYLRGCGKIVTSSKIMLDYVQRSPESMSDAYVPGYFECAMKLHDAKMDCFLGLSKNTSQVERADFIAYDMAREIDLTINRFEFHPKEKEENLPKLNALIFSGQDDPSLPINYMIIAGSSNCEYKVERALEISKSNPVLTFIVSGGNLHKSGKVTEAEFMAKYLIDHGISSDKVFLENKARNTELGLIYSFSIIKNHRKEHGISSEDCKTAILTGAFHIPRARLVAERLPSLENENYYFFPAYGASTTLDNWYCDHYGRQVILNEYEKLIWLSNMYVDKDNEE